MTAWDFLKWVIEDDKHIWAATFLAVGVGFGINLALPSITINRCHKDDK